MTRINVTYQLSDELLLNALGEETRVFNNVINRIQKNQPFNDIPNIFRLNKGHMTFFYDKCDYILKRYFALRYEYKKRFNKEYSLSHRKMVINRYRVIENFNSKLLCNNWEPTFEDENLVKLRILEKSKAYVKTHHYYGEPITDWKTFLKI
jgi:hypothetical protein